MGPVTTKRWRVLMIDHQDSFTWNLVAVFRRLNTNLEVFENKDMIRMSASRLRAYDAMVFSPGPKSPLEHGSSLDLLAAWKTCQRPFLGICLGHQCLAAYFSADVRSYANPVHGRTSQIVHDQRGIFANVPNPLRVMRYHSLCVDSGTLPADLVISASIADSPSDIMGLRHLELPWESVQFHPESFLSERGEDIVQNFVSNIGIR